MSSFAIAIDTVDIGIQITPTLIDDIQIMLPSLLSLSLLRVMTMVRIKIMIMIMINILLLVQSAKTTKVKEPPKG
jgi:hypothetical protein